jgi:hypothetical protein
MRRVRFSLTVAGSEGLPESLASLTEPRHRAFAELLIDCEEDRTLRAVIGAAGGRPQRPMNESDERVGG